MSDSPVPVRVGQAVPDFTMESYDPVSGDFSKVSLADQKEKGRWTILFFYPADFTFVCATEFEALAEKYEQFKRLGADIVTVSKDTKFTHLAWRSHEKELRDVKYAMASDNQGMLARQLGTYDEASGLALRGARRASSPRPR
jgi:peroxiredoxin (alkyl hydroperoxide reductase subunit C)